MKGFAGFCDRCGAFSDRLRDHRDCLCPACELGMHSLAAAFDPPWPRAMTAREIHLAWIWLMIERDGAAA